MDDQVRIAKNKTIGESRRKTILCHTTMRPLVVELKLDLKCLNKAELNKLYHFFVECRWLCNYLISLDSDSFRNFNTQTRSITSLDKDGNPVARELTMPAKFMQSVCSSLKRDMKALAAKRKKTGKKNGKLKFRAAYDSIELNQYGNTHWICYDDEGDRNGRYRNTVHIAGIKRPIRMFGMDQIPEDAEFANAKLVKKPSGIYLMLTCYIPKHEGKDKKEAKLDIGIDFGIKTTITTSEGEKYEISIRESERLKGLQKKFARQITGRKLIAMQDENIKGWHKGFFGREVQNSALGTLKRKLQANPHVIVIDRFFPSTKMCICGHINESITLSDRVFECPVCGYTEDRDVKAAKTLLLAGEHEKACTCLKGIRTPAERMSDFDVSYEAWKRSAFKPEAPSSKR